MSSILPYQPALDGVRGIAILMVMLFHFGLLDMGWMGVEFFFVLSGYLITGILLKGKSWPLGFYLKRFYWRRALRIFPLYFGFLAVLLSVYLLTGHPTGTELLLPYLATYTFNIAMLFIQWTEHMFFHYLWSLSFEEQFYLIWPMLMFVLPRRGILLLCAGLVLFSPLIRFGLGEYLTELRGTSDLVGGMVYYFPAGQLDTFATGGLIAVLGLEKRVRFPLRIFGTVFSVFLIAGLVNHLFFLQSDPAYPWSNLGYPVASMVRGQHIWGHSLINLTAGALILVGIHPDAGRGGYLRRLLASAPMIAIGRISYGIYILHWPLQMILERFVELQDNPFLRAAQFLVFLAFVYGVSWLSYRFYESRFLRLKTTKFHPPPDIG
jgi:peptidoglycan/LPS O-acetylase OafA/YrhL